MIMDVDIEERPDEDESLEGVSSDEMGKLFNEAKAVKMLNLRRILSAGGGDDPERGAEAMKHSQVALKAISIQLNILSEEFRRELGRGRSEKVDTIFEAMADVPKMKAMVSRDAIRDQVLDNLKAMLDEEERIAAKAARTFSGGTERIAAKAARTFSGVPARGRE
jgi:hypothetical protein